MKRVLPALLLLASPLWAQIEPPKPVERVTASGATIAVDSSAAANAALAAAQPGSTIVLDSTKVFRALVVPDGKAGITLRPSGESVVIESDGAAKPALAVGLGTSDLSFQRLTFQSTNAGTTAILYILVRCGYNAAGNAEANTVAALPNRVEFSECRFLGAPNGNNRIGLLGNARNLVVSKCVFREFHEVTTESQALLITNSPGPFLIEDSDFESAGEGVMLGGSNPTIPQLTIGDLTFVRNRINKPIAWKGSAWGVKNLFELKHCVRGYVADNVMTNNWLAAQQGTAVLFTSRNGGRIADVVFENNVIQSVGAGFHLSAGDDNQPGGPTTGAVRLQNNLWFSIGQHEGTGRVYNLSTPDTRQIESLEILGDRWTIAGAPLFGKAVAFFEGPAASKAVKSLVMRRCMGSHSQYGLIGSSTGTGKATLDKWCATYDVTGNVFLNGGTAAAYPANNFFVVP